MATVTVRPVKVGCEFRYSAQVPTPAVFQVQPLAEAPVSVLSGATSIEPDTPSAATPTCTATRANAPQGPHPDRPRAGRLRRRDGHHARRPFLESMVVYCEQQRP
jgi:hypothetical protein